jgi:O-antigen ligase
MAILAGGPMADQFDFASARLGSADTASDRWVIWDAGLRMIAAKPLVGWGYGDYSLYAGNFQRAVRNYVAPNAHASHNAYLTIAGELGLPALVLWLFPVVWWLWLSFKAGPRMPKKGFWSRSLLVVLWMVILIHVVSTFFSDMRYSSFGQGMWWITLGLIANMVSIYLQAAPDSTVPARPTSQLDALSSTG